MKIKISIDETELKKLVTAAIQRQLPEGTFDEKKVKIETKSTQNYRSEWEDKAGFRATYEAEV